MREIIFKAKADDSTTIGGIKNAWVEGDLINFRENEKYIMDQNYGDWDVTYSGTEVIKETISEYTGRKTNNNKRIFENDTVAVKRKDWGSFADGKIVFKDGKFLVEIGDGDIFKEMSFYDEIYVTGNIYGEGTKVEEEV